MQRKTIAFFFALGVLAAAEGSARAGQPFFEEIIPASACQLEHSNDLGKADLVDGSWLISSTTSNDLVELLCPVRTSHFFILALTITPLEWWHFEMHYRDPDGVNTSHSVSATLIEVLPTSAFGTVVDTLSSNTSAPTSDAAILGTVDDFMSPVDDAQHFLRIVLKQGANDGTNRTRFSRARLFVDPPAL